MPDERSAPVEAVHRRVALARRQASRSLRSADERSRAVSSAVERLVYTERVGGSNPSPPTHPWRIDSRAGSTRSLSGPGSVHAFANPAR